MNISKGFIKDFLWSFFHCEPQSIYIHADYNCEQTIILNKDEYNYIDVDEETSDSFQGYDYTVSCGASKMVFIFPEFDSVIKIPFTGEFSRIVDMDDEDCDFDDDDNNVTELGYSDFKNYIEIENQLYNQANDKVKQILLANEFVMNFGNIKIYTQKKVAKTYSDYIRDRNIDKIIANFKDDVKNTIHEIISSRTVKQKPLPATPFLKDILEYYPTDGKEIIKNINFDDLHDENYGYLENGEPIIFDFSGFSEYSKENGDN